MVATVHYERDDDSDFWDGTQLVFGDGDGTVFGRFTKPVASMDDYVDTAEDNGGVHTNSGIANKAFSLAATGLGGDSWEGAGRIWYATLTSGIGPDTDFAGFPATTITAAQAVSAQAAFAVSSAWQQVKVDPASGSSGGSGSGAPTGTAGTSVVSVTRSGGVTGMSRSGQVRVGEDPRSERVEALLAQVDLASVGSRTPQPDRFVYHFNIRGQEVTIDEHDLSPNLHELSRLLLED